MGRSRRVLDIAPDGCSNAPRWTSARLGAGEPDGPYHGAAACSGRGPASATGRPDRGRAGDALFGRPCPDLATG